MSYGNYGGGGYGQDNRYSSNPYAAPTGGNPYLQQPAAGPGAGAAAAGGGNPYSGQPTQSGGDRYGGQPGGNPYGGQQQQSAPNPYLAAQPASGRYDRPDRPAAQTNPYGSDSVYSPVAAGNPYGAATASMPGAGPTPQQPMPSAGTGRTGGAGAQPNPYGSSGAAADNPYANVEPQGNNNYAMGAMNGTPANAAAKPDKYAILNQVKDINGGISSIDSNLAKLRTLQQRSLDDPDTSENSRTNRELDSLNASTMTTYRNLVTRVTKIKQDPSSGDPMNKDQVGNCDRRLKQAIRDYQMAEAAFQKRLQDQMRRQYLIVKPDASEQEVEQVVNDTNGNTQIFSQALMQSDRRGQSQTALRNVESRHAAIQRIEKQMIELAQLFEQMNVLVEQQEVVVEQVEQRGNETVENVEKANGELTGAVTHARNAKRLKWWCLGITILIILIVVAGVVGWYYTVGPGKVMSTVNNGGRRLVKREPAAAGPAGPAGAAFGTNHRRLPDSSFPAGWKGQGSKTGGSPGAQKLRRRTVDREDVMSMGVHALGQMAGHYLA